MTSLPERLRSRATREDRRTDLQGGFAAGGALLREAADELDRRAVTIQRLMDQAREARAALVPRAYEGEEPVTVHVTREWQEARAYGQPSDAPDEKPCCDLPSHQPDEPEGRLVVDRYVTRREMNNIISLAFAAVADEIARRLK